MELQHSWLIHFLLLLALTPCLSALLETNYDGTIKCSKAFGNGLNMFEILPGIGWDNLENIEKGRIFQLSYNTCKLSNDAKFLIPDKVTILPIERSTVDQYAEVIDTMEQFSSVTAKSINVDSSFKLPFISGSYSSEYQKAKSVKMEQQGISSTFRVQARYQRYMSILDQDTIFHSDFRKRLLEVAKNILLDNRKMAKYLSQLIVRDYGTHVILKYDAGGLIIKEDEIQFTSESDRQTESESLKVSSAVHFHALFGLIRASSNHEQQQNSSQEKMQTYMDKIQSSEIKAHGGPVVNMNNFSITEWISKLDNNLIPLDRKGIHLYELITLANLKELPAYLIPELQNYLKHAVVMYYKRNVYYGCTQMTSKNFNAKANVDDNTCIPEQDTKFTFGGSYQFCDMIRSDNGDICDKLTLNNYLTGQPNCPDGFKTTEIDEKTIQSSTSERVCKKFWFVKYKCHEITHVSQASVKSYWCGVKESGKDIPYFRFGGAFSDFRANPVTNDHSCPKGYLSATLNDDLTFCFTSDETLAETGLRFGGMFTCKYGNPMVSGSKRCPSGFSQHIVSTNDDCDVFICMKYKNIFGINQTLPVVVHPPFIRMPKAENSSDKKHSVLIDNDNNWFKDSNAFERIFEIDQSKNFQKISTIFSQASLNWERLSNVTSALFG